MSNPKISTEIVPLDYLRAAYNNLNGTNLPPHNGLLTHEQAQAIQRNFDLELHFGNHGTAPLPHEAETLKALICLPTDVEYDAAKQVVSRLKVGDTLFVELSGYDDLDTLTDYKTVGQLRLKSPFDKDVAARQGTLRGRLEKDRENQKVSAWEYATRLAQLRGIAVVYADFDYIDMNGEEALIEASPPQSKQDSIRLELEMDNRREIAARNIMKDYALEHLPQDKTGDGNDCKPKLALLFGSYHADNLTKAFNDIGLRPSVYVMEATGYPGRLAENIKLLTRRILEQKRI